MVKHEHNKSKGLIGVRHLTVSLTRVGFIAASLVVLLGSSANYVFASTAQYRWTEQTSAGTQTWQNIASSADGGTLATSVYGGSIWTSTNSGMTWIERTGAGSRNWRPIAISYDGMKLAAGAWSGSNIWTSSDGGATWAERTSSGSRNWASITSSSDGAKLAAATNGGSIWTSSDSGATWVERTGAGSVRYITSSSDGTKLAAVSSVSGVWTSEDSGITWTQRTITSGLHSWYSLTSSADGAKLAVGEYGGSIWTSSDSGATWVERTAAGSAKWQALASSANGNILAASDTGGNNTISVSTDSGATWTTQADAGSHTWWHVAMNSDGSKIVATDDDGSIWTANKPNDPLPNLATNKTLVNLQNIVNTAPVSIATPEDTNITCSGALSESDLTLQDPGYTYPLGLVRFCFTTATLDNKVAITFATDLKPEEVTVRHLNATTGSYSTVLDAALSRVSLNGHAALRATYTVTDNGPLDEDANPGSITDPIGLAVPVGVPNTGIDQRSPSNHIQAITLTSLFGYCLYRIRARQGDSRTEEIRVI